MTWIERNKVSLRREFVILAEQPDANIRQLCRRYNISATTGRVAFDDELLSATLKRGTNTVLVRVENLGESEGWGLVMHTVDPEHRIEPWKLD